MQHSTEKLATVSGATGQLRTPVAKSLGKVCEMGKSEMGDDKQPRLKTLDHPDLIQHSRVSYINNIKHSR